MMMMLRAGEMSNMKLARRVGLTAASSRDGIYSKRILQLYRMVHACTPTSTLLRAFVHRGGVA